MCMVLQDSNVPMSSSTHRMTALTNDIDWLSWHVVELCHSLHLRESHIISTFKPVAGLIQTSDEPFGILQMGTTVMPLDICACHQHACLTCVTEAIMADKGSSPVESDTTKLVPKSQNKLENTPNVSAVMKGMFPA